MALSGVQPSRRAMVSFCRVRGAWRRSWTAMRKILRTNGAPKLLRRNIGPPDQPVRCIFVIAAPRRRQAPGLSNRLANHEVPIVRAEGQEYARRNITGGLPQ